LSTSLTSLKPIISVDSKYKLKLLDKKVFQNKILVYNNSKERITPYSFGASIGEQQSINQLVGLNLDNIFEASGEKENLFFDSLEDILEVITDLVEKKITLISKRPYIEQKLLNKTRKGICLSGLFDVSKVLNETNSNKIMEKIITLIHKQDFLVMENPVITTPEKFSEIENRLDEQKELLNINSKHRKNYGFKYEAKSLKEAENLLTDCPIVEINLKNDNS